MPGRLARPAGWLGNFASSALRFHFRHPRQGDRRDKIRCIHNIEVLDKAIVESNFVKFCQAGRHRTRRCGQVGRVACQAVSRAGISSRLGGFVRKIEAVLTRSLNPKIDAFASAIALRRLVSKDRRPPGGEVCRAGLPGWQGGLPGCQPGWQYSASRRLRSENRSRRQRFVRKIDRVVDASFGQMKPSRRRMLPGRPAGPAGWVARQSAGLADLRVVDDEFGKSRPSTRDHSTQKSMQLQHRSR